MGLNINNSNNRLSIFRMNGIYCAIIFIVHYIICLNGFIYMEYDENKHHYDECLWRRYPIDFSDYHKYGPSFRECVFFFTDPDTNLVEVIIYFLPFVVAYVAYVRMRRRPLTLKQFLKTDIFVWSFFSFIFIYIPFSNYYIPFSTFYRYYSSTRIDCVIRMHILNPILLILMIWFRYRQYKKYGVIKNGILSSTREMLYVIQQKVYNLVIRFNHKR